MKRSEVKSARDKVELRKGKLEAALQELIKVIYSTNNPALINLADETSFIYGNFNRGLSRILEDVEISLYTLNF